MSTRSFICRENADGTYTGIYCHSDGYLTHNGAILLDHYTDREKLDKLLSLGNLSYLQPRIDPDSDKPHRFEPEQTEEGFKYDRQEGVCLFYGRDRGEQDQQTHPVRLEEIYHSWSDYCYIFNKEGRWQYFIPESAKVVLYDVETDLNDMFERCGVRRPIGDYGIFSEEYMANLKAEQQLTAEQANGVVEM